MKLCTDGLIIKEQKVGENDRLVTVLTRDNGILKAFAMGAMKMNGKNHAGTQLLCYSTLVISKNKGTYRIVDSEPIEIFFELRNNIEALSLSFYFCELCASLAPEEQADDFLKLMLNTLKFLADGKFLPLLLKSVFEMRILSLAGYMPDLTACAVCGNEDEGTLFFDCASGTLYCSLHENDGRKAGIPLEKGVLAAMRHIIYSDLKNAFAFFLPEQGLRRLSEVCEYYLLSQTEQKYKTLEFFHSL